MRTGKERLILVMLASAIISTTLLLTGCTNDNEIITIRTTGATFPQYQIQKWIDVYQKNHPNVKIEYEGGGSGHGQEAFLQGLTHIGRTDPPVKKIHGTSF